MSSVREETHSDDLSLLEVGRQRIQAEMQVITSLMDTIDEHFLAALHMLASCQGKVLVSGVGASAAVARRMAHVLTMTGTAALYFDVSEAIHGLLGAVEPADILIAISKTGGTAEINTMAEHAIGRGASLLVLTSNPDSPLTQVATLTITLPLPEESDLGNIIAMGSTLAVSVWSDALAAALMKHRSYSWQEVFSSHPGGAVGLHSPSSVSALDRPLSANGNQDAQTGS